MRVMWSTSSPSSALPLLLLAKAVLAMPGTDLSKLQVKQAKGPPRPTHGAPRAVAASAAAPLRSLRFQRHEPAALLGSGSGKLRQAAQPPGWFGAFSQAESTYDEDGVNEDPDYPEAEVANGDYEAGSKPGLLAHGGADGFPPDWFQESRSGGPKEAWQTQYPLVEGLGSSPGGQVPWRRSSNGKWQQHYKPPMLSGASSRSNAKSAVWFDTGVDLYDSFGRPEQPDSSSGRAYIEWQERTKNVSLTCKNPGCIANATIAMFDAVKERVKHCRLTMKVHPTDFDDEYSRENVEWTILNGAKVNAQCNPYARGCNATAQAPLYPCLESLDITDFIDEETGALKLASKITDMVDECPTATGNLLDGVAMATCFVADKVQLPPPGLPPSLTPAPSDVLLSDHGTCKLQCKTTNCTAQCTVRLNQKDVENKTCKLGVILNQTDFDGDLGSVEVVNYIKADGKELGKDIKPGKNPCKLRMQGTALTQAQISYEAVKDHDVTADAKDGTLLVEGQISEKVDECASNGNLLDAIATVNCTGP